ncbi:MAG: hypothetical protein M3Z04_20875 [Chloroflexota bacterium]|nr:hypothetical protein [Chloroflexota bacterium]
MATTHAPRARPRISLAARLQSRLDVLIDRLRLTPLPPEAISGLAAALDGVVAHIAAAEHSVGGHEWALALRAAQNCRLPVSDLLTQARLLHAHQHSHPDPVLIGEGVWVWLVAQAELYCKLQLLHQGLALRDPDDLDDDNDTEMFDFTAHVGEEWLRQLDGAERAALSGWRSDRYRFYRTLYTDLTRLRGYTTARGWVEESDALNYMLRRARMRGLTHYVFGRGSHQHHQPPPGWQRTRRFDRLSALGRLLLDRFYWLTAGFGYRPLRVLLVNSVVVLAFAWVYWYFQLLCVFYTSGGQAATAECQAVSFPQSLYFSALAFFLAAMGEILPRPLWGQALLVLQSIWGFLNVSVVVAIVINRQASNG